ncbi:MAG: hypothetical protein ACYS26_11430, partial [Planctomycetota bacterium]
MADDNAQGGLLYAPIDPDQVAEERIRDDREPYPAFEAQRPQPLFEAGDPFLGTGPLQPGTRLSTGQVVQNQFLVHGALRTASQIFDAGSNTTGEVATRLDLRADWKLSGTERLVAEFRPIDSDRGDFSGFSFAPEDDVGFEGEFNESPTALFFEGELGELPPGLDRGDRYALDWGFSVGR